jgi:hypothetical protein
VPGLGATFLAAHPVPAFGEMLTAVAVIMPEASLTPLAKMQVPRVMSASPAIEVLVNVVEVVKVTVVSPFGPVRISVWPLI